eukprot:g8754.t1
MLLGAFSDTPPDNIKSTRKFDEVFPASSLHAAFRQHDAYSAVFETEASLERDQRAAEFERMFGDKCGRNPTAAVQKFPGNIVALSEGSAAKDGVIADATPGVDFRLTPARSGLISAIMTACNYHVDLVLRPDDVWLTILAQLCAYVNKHAEELRGRIVEHEGKKQHVVHFDSMASLEAETPRMIRELLGQIRANIRTPDLADWFRPGFSTTTENDEISAAATAMASLQAYFEYVMMTSCGIPSVTLMGTAEDWRLLQGKIERLLEFEVDGNPEGKVMEPWVGYLRKVCDGFVESAEHPGSAHALEFWDKVWQAMSHVGGGPGSIDITGCLAAFTSFDKDGNFIGKWTNGGGFPRISTSSISHNVVSCPVKIDDSGRVYDAHLVVGGVALDARDVVGEGCPTVRPRNDWPLR